MITNFDWDSENYQQCGKSFTHLNFTIFGYINNDLHQFISIKG
jgi:hypothetical protein